MANIRDLAEKAELSIATVSRVINNSSKVSENTRKKVEQAIKELDYHPPIIAKGLYKKRLKTIGLLMPDIKNFYYAEVIEAIEKYLNRINYNIFLSSTNENVKIEENYINTFLTKGVDGLMFLGTRPTNTPNDYIVNLSKKIPVLMINDYIIGSNVYSVMIDEVEGSYKAVNYLINLGHSKIGFINGDVEYTTYKYKLEGYKKALENNGIDIYNDFIINEDPHEEGGYKGAKILLQLPHRPTALFVASDQIAIGAMKAIYENGLLIPKNISLIGFSNIGISKHLYPELTTIDQYPYKTGELAAKIIIKLINGEELEQKRFLLEPKLCIRKSCDVLNIINLIGDDNESRSV